MLGLQPQGRAEKARPGIIMAVPSVVVASGQPRPPAFSDPTPGGQQTILVVEDEPVLLKLITRILQTRGYQVLGANGPGQALELARSWVGRIDLVLTDVIMPEMNGLELVNQLVSGHPGLKHMFMSGYTADILADLGFAGEHTKFLQKPFSGADLARGIRQALELESGATA